MPIDLSIASDDGLILILLRVPIKDLIEKCTQVSPQWNRILSENFFWREKMDYDGYHLDWRKLAGISTKSFQTLALKHCFNQNFIKDNWNLAVRSLTIDPRWIHLAVGDIFAPIEIPPEFVDGQPEIPPGYEDKPIEACVSVGREIYRKLIVINLADEGLTNEIMDKFRPTIVVSEMIGNRRDCAYTYQVKCSLEDRHDTRLLSQFWCEANEGQREIRKEFRDKNGRWVGATIVLRSYQGQAEGWHRLEITFKNYPAGMRYLTLSCVGIGNDQNARGDYGLKLADCSVKALFEKNATE